MPYKSPEELKKYTKELYRWRKEHGICTCCGKHEAAGGVRCAECASNRNEKLRQRYHDMTEEEKREHLAKKSERMKALRKYRKENGLCYMCGKPAYKEYGTCYEHWLYRRNYNRKYEAEKRKGYAEIGKCRICGKDVVPGKKHCEEHLEQKRKAMAHAEQFVDRSRKKRRAENDG